MRRRTRRGPLSLLRTTLANGRSAVGARSAAMIARAEGPVRRGTRRRAVGLVVAGSAALTAMFGMVSANVLAVNFTSANQTFDIYSDYIQGVSGAAFVDEQVRQDGSKVGVTEMGFESATLNGFCAIAHQALPVVGDVSLMIVAGEPVAASFDNGVNQATDPSYNAIKASYLYLASDRLAGFGNNISGLTLGQSADSVAVPGDSWAANGMSPTAGAFGIQADHMNVGGLSGRTFGINLKGAITLPNLKIKVLTGARTQSDCPTQATS